MASAPVQPRSGSAYPIWHPIFMPTSIEPVPAMIRLPARLVHVASAALALVVSGAAPLAAQDNPGTFTLPTATPTPAPAPAGPADERAGVVIPPRSVPTPRITPVPVLTPEPQASPSSRTASTSAPTSAPTRTPPAATPSASASAMPAPLPTVSSDPLALPTSVPGAFPEIAPDTGPDTGNVAALPTETGTDTSYALPAWWPLAAGGLGALALLGGGLLLRRRRKPRALRLAAPSAAAAAPREAARGQGTGPDLADLYLTLDVTAATRSVMMFTIGYRLNIANRAGRAVTDMRAAVQLVCARASAGVPSVGAAQALGAIERIGPHQARSITGEVQLPLSAIQPLRQGTTPLFVPLIHVTIEAEGQPAVTKTFVIGTPSASGRVHPIQLDQTPGGIAGLVAQAVAVPAAAAA